MLRVDRYHGWFHVSKSSPRCSQGPWALAVYHSPGRRAEIVMVQIWPLPCTSSSFSLGSCQTSQNWPGRRPPAPRGVHTFTPPSFREVMATTPPPPRPLTLL